MKVGVIGTGAMGAGIVQAFAQAGHEVLMRSRHQETLDKAMKIMTKLLARAVEKEKITQADMDATLARVTCTTELAPFADVDFLVESVAENMEVKKELFKQLDEICRPDIMIVTNTSSLSITEIASVTKRPDKVCGMHFFNPVGVMKLVEIVRGQKTSDETIEAVKKLSEELGKTTVLVSDAPAFVVNRILLPMLNEAVGLLADGVASAEDIDTAMKLGANHPMGPLELGDLVGLDVACAAMTTIYEETGNPKYAPHVLLKKMVRAGEYGRKTGKGFYTYE